MENKNEETNRSLIDDIKDIKNHYKYYLTALLIGLLPALYFGGVIYQLFKNALTLGVSKSYTLNPFTVIYIVFSNKFAFLCFLLIMVFVFLIARFAKDKNLISDLHDYDRNFDYSEKGTYGTSGYMTENEKRETFNIYDNVSNTSEIILGREKESESAITIPSDAWINKHIAVFGASGTGKSRAFARPYILQGIKRGESFIVTDPKGELYESMSPMLREEGYDVKMLNLVRLKHSDAWNCLAEIEGDEITAQIFTDAIIQNTSGKDNGDFWSMCEMNLLKALCLYVEKHPALDTNMSEVYSLLTTKQPYELDAMFDALPMNDGNKATKSAYNIFKNASDNIKGGVVIGLGSRLQVFQSKVVERMTSSKEIDLVKPGKEKCAYFCVTSDQHSAFDFIAVLFYSMLFIKLVEFADSQPGSRCPVPVNFVLDEFPNIGSIPDFCKKISTVRSRGLNISVIFQNIAQLQNRYPRGQWEEILGNCDTHLFLGCTDMTTAKFISEKTGIVTVATSSHSYTEKKTPFKTIQSDGKSSESVGKRNLLTPDEVLRYPDALIFIRGKKPLQIRKYDYSLHPDASRVGEAKIVDYTPDWRRKLEETECNNQDNGYDAPYYTDNDDELNSSLLSSVTTRKSKNNRPTDFI